MPDFDARVTITKECTVCGCQKRAPVSYRGWLLCSCWAWLYFEGVDVVRDEYAVWAAYDASLARGSEEARRLAALKEIDVLESWWALP